MSFLQTVCRDISKIHVTFVKLLLLLLLRVELLSRFDVSNLSGPRCRCIEAHPLFSLQHRLLFTVLQG